MVVHVACREGCTKGDTTRPGGNLVAGFSSSGPVGLWVCEGTYMHTPRHNARNICSCVPTTNLAIWVILAGLSNSTICDFISFLTHTQHSESTT